MFWYSSMFYSEKFKKIIVGTYGKNLVLSIVKGVKMNTYKIQPKMNIFIFKSLI